MYEAKKQMKIVKIKQRRMNESTHFRFFSKGQGLKFFIKNLKILGVLKKRKLKNDIIFYLRKNFLIKAVRM